MLTEHFSRILLSKTKLQHKSEHYLYQKIEVCNEKMIVIPSITLIHYTNTLHLIIINKKGMINVNKTIIKSSSTIKGLTNISFFNPINFSKEKTPDRHSQNACVCPFYLRIC